MAFGMDYVTGPPVTELKSAGVTFVCRYLSEINPATQVKLLTPAEAKALGQAGIAIVSNYEWYGNRAAEGFVSGVADAQIAAGQHTACGGPANRPIYFSVDFDTGTTAPIIDYFKGVASVIGLHRTGAYGSYSVIKGLFDASVIAWGWQTYAWSAGLWEPRAHIQQYSNGMSIAGLSVDYNHSIKGDFGQWIPGGEDMIPNGWAEQTVNGVVRLVCPNGHYAIAGFRNHIESDATWNPANQLLEEEYQTDQVQLHNLSLGAGSRVTTRDKVLWYTVKQGVIDESELGAELKACYDQIAAQQAEIATLKAAAVIMPNVADAVSQLEAAQAANGVIGTSLVKALTDLKQ
jgi:hypothetical protein